MIIDSHVHVWRRARGDYGWLTPNLGVLWRDFSPADLERTLASAGVDGAILVQAAPSHSETEHLLDLARAHPLVRGVVGWIDLVDPSASALIARWSDEPLLKGLRPMLQDMADDDHILRADASPTFRALEETGFVFEALVRPRHLARLRRLRERHPRLRMVVDHGAKPDIAGRVLHSWASDLRDLAADGLTFCKLSGLVTEAESDWSAKSLRPYAEAILEAFGPSRVLWGSDWPVVLQASDYQGWLDSARWLTAGFDRQERDLIFGGVARAVYRLST